MPEYFEKEKKDFLNKIDKSKKGSIDKDALKLVSGINSKANYYTTSSCAGRIVLLEKLSRKKNKCRWLLVKHSKVTSNEIYNCLKDYKSKNNGNEVWFKQEPLIIHVRCKNIEAAKRFLDASRKLYKRTGIISLNDKKIMIELIGNERIDTIIANQGWIADVNYIKELVKHANRNFMENKKKISKFLKIIKKL